MQLQTVHQVFLPYTPKVTPIFKSTAPVAWQLTHALHAHAKCLGFRLVTYPPWLFTEWNFADMQLLDFINATNCHGALLCNCQAIWETCTIEGCQKINLNKTTLTEQADTLKGTQLEQNVLEKHPMDSI